MSEIKSNIKRKKKRVKKSKHESDLIEEEKRLEKAVLGKKHGFQEIFSDTKSPISNDEEKNPDTKPELKGQKKPAWTDDDDTKLQIPCKLKKYSTGASEDSYQNLLRRQFGRVTGIHKWAEINKNSELFENEEIEELMRSGSKLKKKSVLSKGTLNIEKMVDLNKETKIEGPLINAVEFHPTATVALVAGISGITSIFQVDGISNSKLQTVKFKNFHIDCAHFTCDGEQFIIGSKDKRTFFYYDMMEGKSVPVSLHHGVGVLNMSKFCMSPDGKFIVVCGKFGTMHLLSAKTKEWIGDLKMNHDVVDVSFMYDGARMYSYSSAGEIFEWDMNNRYCIRKMYDEGCVRGITMSISPNGQMLATGSASGIVNLYEMPIKNEHMVPVKVIKNLLTPITAMTFNSTSEILAIASNEEDNAVRLVHFPSLTVFSNFPGFSKVGRPRVLNFSPLSGYLALGTGQRKVMLYRLQHYKNY